MGTLTDLLTLVATEPTLFPPAPLAALTDSRHLDHRRLDEVHTCLGCGQRAHSAFLAETKIGPRWLDLCAECTYRLRREDDTQ